MVQAGSLSARANGGCLIMEIELSPHEPGVRVGSAQTCVTRNKAPFIEDLASRPGIRHIIPSAGTGPRWKSKVVLFSGYPPVFTCSRTMIQNLIKFSKSGRILTMRWKKTRIPFNGAAVNTGAKGGLNFESVLPL
ncbi:MAG: hypothetical protein SRB2_02692 [Desulfobacteraceae bacterium Eth-SRB2]|nr:MAG: hypothetical protein SRB2_02692 [Desulfobacteraceae bacterium Eth-SRB2]